MKILCERCGTEKFDVINIINDIYSVCKECGMYYFEGVLLSVKTLRMEQERKEKKYGKKKRARMFRPDRFKQLIRDLGEYKFKNNPNVGGTNEIPFSEDIRHGTKRLK
jgi:hypothetical protein